MGVLDIRIQNIGIVKDSTIKVEGITVITGENNSGKTTVGKALYSLIDGVSNLQEKSVNDRYNYAISKIRKAIEEFPPRVRHAVRREELQEESLKIFFAGDLRASIDKEMEAEYIADLIEALNDFTLSDDKILEYYISRLEKNEENIIARFYNQKERAVEILQEALERVTSDPELVAYTRSSINRTLLTEFYGQIHPVSNQNICSEIEISDRGETYFKIELSDNVICNKEETVFWNSPYKKVFFIDNPFLVDEPPYRRLTKYINYDDSFVNESRIITHDNKLKFILNYTEQKSVFEYGLAEAQYRRIKQKIDEVLPGDFVDDEEERFYVEGEQKLKLANLATGSKTFTIIKELLERGEIDKDTLLILDEPESHLHPKWQNAFVEIIIMMVKEIGCHILLTTHSSHFMLAVDAFMRKYEIEERCNFYKTEKIDGGKFVRHNCVNDSMNTIYQDFLKYLSEIKMLRDDYVDSPFGE